MLLINYPSYKYLLFYLQLLYFIAYIIVNKGERMEITGLNDKEADEITLCVKVTESSDIEKFKMTSDTIVRLDFNGKSVWISKSEKGFIVTEGIFQNQGVEYILAKNGVEVI